MDLVFFLKLNSIYSMRNIIITAFSAIILLSSCLKSSNTTCTFSACGITATTTEIQTLQNYLSTNSLTAIQHCSGLFYRIENPGTGTTPTVCSSVLVRYKGYLMSGSLFDEATTAVTINLSQVITSWKIGLPLLKADGRIVLYVPPSLAYGNQEV